VAAAVSESERYFKRALKVSPGGVHSPVRAFSSVRESPLFMHSANGSSLTDMDGRSYTDYCMAFGPLILGHRDPLVAAAAEAAINDGWSYGTAECWSLELAELISSRIQWAEQIRFVNSGTEAVMSALRLARAVTKRERILKFSGCYHGHTDAMLIEAGSGLAGTPASAGIPNSVARDTLVLPLDDIDQLKHVFSDHGAELAAAIIEPIPANYGLLLQKPAFLRELRALCSRYGVMLIFDEVISGFRTAFGGCAEELDIEPDLVTWGKIIGGGFPVGAYAGRSHIMQRIAPVGDVYQAGTLSANPLAMRAGLATLCQLTDGAVYEKLEQLGAQLDTELAATDQVQLIRKGSIFWLHLSNSTPLPRARDAISQSHAHAYPELFTALLKTGIYFPPSPYEVSFLSAAHTPQNITDLAQTIFQTTEKSAIP
jgi:glutamate-1-semialdehyde 2,1-aminomutase